jgi:hypothetical protein
MNHLAAKLNIDVNNPEDWMKLKISDIVNNGGGKILPYYTNSKERLLKTLYPQYPNIILE